ncbi:pleckstrin homology domain-containing family A member 7-like [Pristis pectinata]|uniref:pleckstrin homology domain-containing family A member 7-like n=1 Tax=Pristis pectinata TaxID=685728 RepID=UPI00223D57E0|nr:pleckstrin homology domain-containing family A member 7-like [Pristis pectinata]
MKCVGDWWSGDVSEGDRLGREGGEIRSADPATATDRPATDTESAPLSLTSERLTAAMSEVSDRPRSEISQGSSIGTISSLTTPLGSKPIRPMKKVHTFGKREQAIKRDPNSVTVIRGWLNKQDSSGLKLWKRRWFVLSDFCLFYYRDSREERILGSIPMPSYTISAIDPQDRKSRKFAFKVQSCREFGLCLETWEENVTGVGWLGWFQTVITD